ncbi:MAG TPA: tetratricopeptide repeat protein [Thermoanaerobaculia bacterium]
MATLRPDADDAPTQMIMAPPAPPEARTLEPGDRLAGRYRIQERIGKGGMGVVYRALDMQLGLCVALKVLRSDFSGDGQLKERFRRELILARQVTHRNAVRIHDIGQDGDLLFLTMDYVAGQSLRALLRKEGPLSAERAAAILRQLALALEVAHEEGVVHRDLKPANVLIDTTERAYVTDFGVARSLNSPGVTRAGTVIGTLDYLSPEQAGGEEVDARSDLYALGILLFEMLTGELPFAGSSAAETLAQRLTGATRDLQALRRDVPPRLAAIARRLLERDPARRFQSARELIDALDGNGRKAFRLPVHRLAAAVAASALLAAGWLLAPWDHTAASTPPSASTATGPRHAVAVLPLLDETGRPDLAWISGGVAEMLATALGESPELRVVSSARVFQTIRDMDLPDGPLGPGDLRRLAEILGADRLITGKVRSAGGRLRVDLSLVSSDLAGLPASALHSEGASAAEIFAVSESLGRTLRERLNVEPAEIPPASSSPAALRAYSQGIARLARHDDLAAVPALEQAVAADPKLTSAWVSLARARAALGRHEEAQEAARRAVATLGPRSGRAAYEAQALEAQLRGDSRKAREILSSLVKSYPHDVEARVELAEVCREQGDLDTATATLKRVVEIDPDHPRAWLLLAKSAIRAGDSRRAVNEYLVHALVVQNRLGSETGQAEVLNAQGVAHHELGELGQAVESYEKAAGIRQRIGDERGHAATLRNLAAVHTVRGEQEKAEERLAEAMEILRRLGDPEGLADLYNDLGLLAEERGRYQEAIEHYRQSLQLRRRLGQTLAVAETLSNVGYACYLLGRFDDATVYWQQGLDLYRQGGDRAGVVLGTQGIGLLQTAQGDWDAATKSFLDALRASRDLGLKEATAASLGHLGRVELLQGRFRAALASFAEALVLLRELGDVRGQTEFTLAEAEAWLRIGELDAARKRMDTAERLLAESRNGEQQADLLRLRGEWHLVRNERGPAREALLRAVAEAEASHGLVALLQARIVQARLAGDLNNLRSLQAEANDLGHRLLQLQTAEALAETALSRGDLETAEDAARHGLDEARNSGSYANAYRLHLLLARTLESRGQGSEAADHRASAAAEIRRLRNDLTPAQRKPFDTLAEIRGGLDVLASR